MLVLVLGSFGGDALVDAGGGLRPMERRLVAALAVRRPAAVSVDSLAEAMWGSEPPTSARKTIQTNVLRVRNQLGRNAIETVEEGYRLGADVEVDIERFERAVHEAAASRHDGTAPWDAALAWCGDAPLDELRHWPPADGRRAQLEELRRSAIESRWESALLVLPPDDLIPELEALVAAEPLREQRWSLLMSAYLQAGRRVDGLRAFERARRTLALEIGVSPGPELVERYEALLRDQIEAPDAPPHGAPSSLALISLSDRRRSEALTARARGDASTATQLFVDAARHAREGGDVRRLAEAALGAAGEGWRATIDATDEIVLLLTEALDNVPAGPTRLRTRLLSRVAIAQSHHRPAGECEVPATKALAIARAVDEADLVAGALHALSVVVWDPERRAQHWEWTDELLALAKLHPEEPWRRWALAVVARLRATDGDLDGAVQALDELAVEAARSSDPDGAFAASYAGALRASVAGDWCEARAAAAATRDAADRALLDPAGGALLETGMLGIIGLLEGPADVRPLPPIEWPMPSMELSVNAWYADCLARAGHVDLAVEVLAAIGPTFAADVDHDGYWLATLSMLADAAHLTGDAPMGEAVWDCLGPVTELTILDPGLIYRGTAAHAAGLAAVVCGHRREAAELLSTGLAQHEAHRSPWMVERSRQALASLAV